jgi:cellulose synthase/poly-beta-1,6-N-acetylglucosamine synthase-like glycosyltransferase
MSASLLPGVDAVREAAQAVGLVGALERFFAVVDTPVLLYFLAINSSYLLLVILAAMDSARHLRRVPFAGLEDSAASPLTQPVSLLVPAHDEEAGIVASVRAMLALRYPRFEVVVVDDGSTDGTFTRLAREFGLVEVPRAIPDDVPTTGRVLGVHVPADGRTPLVVVRKENGGKADALNVGLNVSRYPLVAMVDADSVLDPDALLTVAKPFADDPLRTVATGGVVRPVNGSEVVAGRVVRVKMPSGWLARIQVVEYLRAFLLGRSGWSRLQSLILISGAFGLYRRDVVVAVGGMAHTVGEDFELVVRMHRLLRRERRDYRVVFVSEPVSWTEVPATAQSLRRQRHRWHRGLAEVLWRHRGMTANPRYGRIGLLAVPYFWFFELLAPVIELVGIVTVPIGLLLGVVDGRWALLFLLVAYGYAVLVTAAALCVEEFSFARHRRWRDLGVALVAAVLENVGYRQLTAWWRLQGLVSAVLGRRAEWGAMDRAGFDDRAEAELAASRSAGRSASGTGR